MVDVYNAGKCSKNNKKAVLKHLGVSPLAAALRIEDMFAHQNFCAFENDLSAVHIFDAYRQRIIKTVSFETHLKLFCEHAKDFNISHYKLKTEQPLRLIDLWGDDPIGSGGPKVVESSQLSSIQLREIQDIFAPFTSEIFPQHIFQVVSPGDIKGIKRRYAQNTIFEAEFHKRKARGRAINSNFNIEQNFEVVWLDYTLKLRTWALNNGFDSFVYSNETEGNGEDTYVTLLPNQTSLSDLMFKFNEEKYLSEIPDLITEMMKRNRNTNEIINHGLWAQKDPMRYWDIAGG